jgi:diguanylate cyclase (GGDEF)-like protein
LALYLLDDKTGTINARFTEGQDAGNFQKVTPIKGHGIAGWAIANNQDIVTNDAEMEFGADIQADMPVYACVAVFALASEKDRKTSFGAVTLYLDQQDRFPQVLRTRVKNLLGKIGRRIEQCLEDDIYRTAPLSDPITHLPTMSLLYAHAAREIAQARRHSYAVSFLEMELENYEEILQNHGKDETERFLREFARAIRRYLRDGDVLARISESEFAGIFPMTEQAQVHVLLGRLRQCADYFQYQTESGEHIEPSMTFGHASFPEHGKTCESLFLRANTQRFADKMQPMKDIATGTGIRCGKVIPFRL